MLESLPVVLIAGIVLGFLAGLGIGGGSLLILWLTLILGMDSQQARCINLLFFVPAALVSCFLRRKNGLPSLKKLLPGIFAGTASAALFTLWGTSADPQLLRKPFGILLIATALRELFYRPRNPK